MASIEATLHAQKEKISLAAFFAKRNALRSRGAACSLCGTDDSGFRHGRLKAGMTYLG
jgi:hypothetical protein